MCDGFVECYVNKGNGVVRIESNSFFGALLKKVKVPEVP